MEKVILRSEESLDGRNLLIKNAKSFVGRPAEKKQRYHVHSTGTSRMGKIERIIKDEGKSEVKDN